MNAPFDPDRIAAEAVLNAAHQASVVTSDPIDLAVLNQHRRPPPAVPLDLVGPAWSTWIREAAEAAAAPADYVFATLLASASALIGNARWAQATPGWAEPPHLWVGIVGDSGSGKSPGTDAVLGCVLPEIERRMTTDFPQRKREYLAQVETASARRDIWAREVRAAAKHAGPPPLPPMETEIGSAPVKPLLKVQDATIERVGTLIAQAMPKGILVFRDELAGWLAGMNNYNDSGRAFWLEGYGGRPFRIERQKTGGSITIPRLAVACLGGTQPEKLAETMRGADDGLLARFCWTWPEPIPFALAETPPSISWATEALDKLRLLKLGESVEANGELEPIMVPLDEQARSQMGEFGRQMQERQQDAGGLLRSAIGKARGLALRLSLVLEFLRWCAKEAEEPPPSFISSAAFSDAVALVEAYFLPMAERVYGDAARRTPDRNAATLARWIERERPDEVHVRRLQREARLPGLTDALSLHDAAKVLLEAGWLMSPQVGGFQQRGRAAYPVNPALWGALAAIQ